MTLTNAHTAPARPNLLLFGSEDPLFHEKIKGLRAKVEYMIEETGIRSLAVTSAISGEGKTLLSARLAGSLASTGRKRVLLVDADLRKRDLTRSMGFSRQTGLSDLIAGKREAAGYVLKTETNGLDFLPSGPTVESSHEMIAGSHFADVVKELGDLYDFLVFDTPPVLPIADALALRGRIDRFLFVFRALHTPKDLFRQAIEELGTDFVLGVVMNGIESRSDGYYKKYYGKYYVPRTG